MTTALLLAIATASIVILLLLVIKAQSPSLCRPVDCQPAGGDRHRYSG
ncbi:hypothetical protein WDV93_22660 [Pantoea ananatis]